MEKTKELGTQPIGKLLAQYSIPAVIAMLVNAIYNVVDRIFIGQYAGEGALAGLTIAFPVMITIFAFANLIGAGGAALMSIRLGEKDSRGASHVFGNMLSMGVIITIISAVVMLLNLEAVLNLFGATPDIIGYSVDYMRIILFGFIFQMTGFNLSSAVRSEGQPVLSMVSMIASAVTNIILDYLFIGVFDMGVQGAAYATIAGQFLGMVILLSYYIRGKSSLHLKAKDFVPDFKVVSNISTIGFATFISTVGASISMGVLNIYLAKYGGTAAITSMGAVNSLFTLFFMPIMGIQQGLQPIIGYNHGAKQIDRTYETLKLGIIVGVVFSTIVFALLEIFPETFISLFLDQASATMPVAINGLRIYIIMLPLLSINLFGIAFYQSTANGRQSFVLGLLRQIIILIPAIIILASLFGLNGAWAAVPVADGLAVLATSVSLLITYRKDTKTDMDIDADADTDSGEILAIG